MYDLKYYVDQTHPHPNIANYLTHLGIVLSFPCRIRGILPWLLETNTPDELSVIHSTAAEPPNRGTENRGALMEKKRYFITTTAGALHGGGGEGGGGGGGNWDLV